MLNSEPLVPYGIVVIILCGAAILIPYLRGKSDLVTGWNTLLLGLAIYTGLGCLEVRYGIFVWQHLQWFEPTVREVTWYIVASASFIATLLVCYYLNVPAKRFAQRRMQKWPPATAAVTFFVLGCCLAIVTASLLFGNITFFGAVFRNMAHKAAVFACVFSFLLWYRHRLNLAWLLLFIGVFLSATLYSMVVFSGRRLLLSMFLGPILCIYWTSARYWRPSKTITILTLAALLILLVSAVYSTFRWFNVGPNRHQERTATAIIEQIRNLRGQENLFDVILSNRLRYFAQSNVHYSLIAQRFISQDQLTPKPLNTLRFLASYPVPRRLWPAKPEVLGLVITRDAANIQTTNWGVGIPGHGAYEGGIPALMLYAVLFAFGMRLMDEPLRLQPDNPFLISLHAAALPHVVAIPRGDFGIMSIETIECFLFAILLGVTCRVLFGTRQQQPSAAIAAGPWRYRFNVRARQ